MWIEDKQYESGHNEGFSDFTAKQLLTPNEAAHKLKVTPEQIRSLIRKGQLSAVNVGTGTKRPLYRITHQALNDFLKCRWKPLPKMRNKRFKQLSQVPDFFPSLK